MLVVVNEAPCYGSVLRLCRSVVARRFDEQSSQVPKPELSLFSPYPFGFCQVSLQRVGGVVNTSFARRPTQASVDRRPPLTSWSDCKTKGSNTYSDIPFCPRINPKLETFRPFQFVLSIQKTKPNLPPPPTFPSKCVTGVGVQQSSGGGVDGPSPSASRFGRAPRS